MLDVAARHLAATLVTIAVGLGVLRLLGGRDVGIARSRLELAALGWIAGSVSAGVAGALLGRLGLPASLPVLLAVQLPFVVLAATLRRDARRTAPVPLCWWEVMLAVVIVVQLAVVLGVDLGALQRSTDAFKVVLPVVKEIHLAGTPAGVTAFQGRPLLPALMLHWFMSWQASWSELALNLPYGTTLVALSALLYAAAGARGGRAAGLVTVVLVVTAPLVGIHAVTAGYLDLPVALFLTGFVVSLHRFAREGRRDDLVLAIAFLGVLPFLKLEGRTLYLPVGAVLVVATIAQRRGIVSARTCWLVAVAGVVGGIAVLAGLRAGGGAAWLVGERTWRQLAPENHLLEAAPLLVAHLAITYDNFLLAGALAALLVAPLGMLARDAGDSMLGLAVTLLVCTFLYMFAGTRQFAWLANGTSVNRIFLQLFPALVYAAVVLVADRVATQPRPRGIDLGITVAVAVLAPTIMLAGLVLGSSNRVPRVAAIEAWRTAGPWTPTDGLECITTTQCSLQVEPPVGQPFTRLAARLRLHGQGQVLFLWQPSDETETMRARDLTASLTPEAWTDVVIPLDAAPGMQASRLVGLRLVAKGGEASLAVRDPRFLSPSWTGRSRELAGTLLAGRLLEPASVNFSSAPLVAGRGYPVVLWAALGLAAVVLVGRRVVAGEPRALALHFGITVVVLTLAADLRNGADALVRVRQAADAVGDVQAGKPPLEESLRDLPWLRQVVETIRRDLPPGGGYHVELGGLGRGATIEAIDLRLRYLLLPARAVPPAEAALVIVAAGSLADYEGSPEWERIATLEGGLPVYRRRSPA